MRSIAIIAAAVLSFTANAAVATPERFECRKATENMTVVDLDRAARTFNFSEGGQVQLDRQPACATFAKITGPQANPAARCTVAFGTDAVSAEYVSLDGPRSFNLMVALDTKALTLITIVRLGMDAVMADTIPCKRR